MATNFYLRKKLKDQEKKDIHNKLDEFFSGKIREDEFLQYFESSIDRIHLGKRSSGWQFLWVSNPQYENKLSSIEEFITSGDYEIIDEYGTVFTYRDFIVNEIGNCLYEGITYKDTGHYESIPELYRDWITEEGLRFANPGFS